GPPGARSGRRRAGSRRGPGAVNGDRGPRLPRLTRRETVLAAALLATLPLVNPYLRGEGNGYYAYVRSLVLDHDLRFDDEYRGGPPRHRGPVAGLVAAGLRLLPSLLLPRPGVVRGIALPLVLAHASPPRAHAAVADVGAHRRPGVAARAAGGAGPGGRRRGMGRRAATHRPSRRGRRVARGGDEGRGLLRGGAPGRHSAARDQVDHPRLGPAHG